MVGLKSNFTILDSDDQQRIIKKLLKAMQLDENRWVPREVQYFINKHKDEGRRPKDLNGANDPTLQQLIKVYAEYEQACQRAGAVDFAELLLRAYELWRDQPALLQHYRQRFRHVLIDEFQDTNSIQYAWIRLLVGSTGLPFAVGDDDQSIYRWRGARVENLQKYSQDFPQAQLVRLEQNYRSTGSILDAARTCGPAAAAATSCACSPASTNAMRPSSSSRVSWPGLSRAAPARTLPSCTARTPSRACSRRC